MRKTLLAVLLTAILWSCQKEGSVENPISTTPPPTADTLVSIVVDGDYGGYALTDYDSAVLKYTTGSVIINHYSRSKVLVGTETIRYDNSGRVLTYQQREPLNGYSLSRHFEYQGTEPLPSAIDDTLVNGNETEISRTHVTQRNATGAVKALSFLSAVQLLHNPAFNYTLTTNSTYNSNWRLLTQSIPIEYTSTYHYNTAGDVDSCYSKTLRGDDTYFALTYTAEKNPLAGIADSLFRNLAKYAVVDNLDNSHYEDLLDISYFPSELLTTRIPLKSRLGISADKVYDENTFNYRMEAGELKGIIVTHKDLEIGEVSETNIRFYHQ